MMVFAALRVAALTTPSTSRGWTTSIARGVDMPWVSLGTCCGSDPGVGVVPWLTTSRGRFGLPISGIDTAFDYNDQAVIATQLAAAGKAGVRSAVFITTKIPGAAFLHSDPAIVCPSGHYRQCALDAVKRDLAELSIEYADLVLLHDPGLANETAISAQLWEGLQDALALGLARAIGVSNFSAKQLAILLGHATTTTVPAVRLLKLYSLIHPCIRT